MFSATLYPSDSVELIPSDRADDDLTVSVELMPIDKPYIDLIVDGQTDDDLTPSDEVDIDLIVSVDLTRADLSATGITSPDLSPLANPDSDIRGFTYPAAPNEVPRVMIARGTNPKRAVSHGVRRTSEGSWA